MSRNVIETKALTKVYGTQKAVDDLDLTVEPGSITAIVGPNGAGKSTTLGMLLGLVMPTSGQAYVLGMDPVKESKRIREKVGYLPEEQGLYGYMIGRQIIDFTAGFYDSWDKSLENRYVDMFNIPLDKKISEYSKGMKVQLQLTLAFAAKPELIVLDEPTTGLDPIATRKFLQAVLEEVGTTGQSVLMSSHLLYQVERVADKVCIMNNGRMIISKNMDDLKLSEKKIRAAFQVDPPADIEKLPGISRVEKDGRRYVFHVSDNIDEIVAELSKIPHFTIDVIDMNLEDIFMEYTVGSGEKGGDRR